MSKLKTDTINRNKMASLIHYTHPEIKAMDAFQVLKAQEEVIAYGLDTMQKIKFGKLFVIDPTIKDSHRHYDAVNDRYVELPKRLRFKFRPLKQLKEIEDSYKGN